MTILTDHRRVVDLELRNWMDNSGYGPDWGPDFWDIGLSRNINEENEDETFPYADLLTRNGYDEDAPVYEADDIDYLIDYVHDMIDGIGDFDTPSPSTHLFVDELKTPNPKGVKPESV